MAGRARRGHGPVEGAPDRPPVVPLLPSSWRDSARGRAARSRRVRRACGGHRSHAAPRDEGLRLHDHRIRRGLAARARLVGRRRRAAEQVRAVPPGPSARRSRWGSAPWCAVSRVRGGARLPAREVPVAAGTAPMGRPLPVHAVTVPSGVICGSLRIQPAYRRRVPGSPRDRHHRG